MQPNPTSERTDETLDRLVSMVNSTCLVALDKTLYAIRGRFGSYNGTAISERMTRASKEVRFTLPVDQRGGI